MKLVLCLRCIKLFVPTDTLGRCRCGKTAAIWEDPYAGILLVACTSGLKEEIRVIGLNNNWIVDALLEKELNHTLAGTLCMVTPGEREDVIFDMRILEESSEA